MQVPSGLAASGSLITGITSANEITNNNVANGGGGSANGTSLAGNGTDGLSSGVGFGGGAVTGVNAGGGGGGNAAVLNVAYSMIQIAIGITVGLFMSALVVYPFGKRRSGLFSF